MHNLSEKSTAYGLSTSGYDCHLNYMHFLRPAKERMTLPYHSERLLDRNDMNHSKVMKRRKHEDVEEGTVTIENVPVNRISHMTTISLT